MTAALSADGTAVTLDQEPFRFLAGSADDVAEALWSVPVVLRTSTGEVERVLLDERSRTVTLDTKADWVVVNAGAPGFYRVRYSAALLQALLGDLAAAQLTPLERHAVASDTHSAMVAGLAPVPDLVEVIRALASDDDPDVWTSLASSLAFLVRLAHGTEAEDLATALVRQVAGPALDRVGWAPVEGEGDRTATLRGVLVGLLGGPGQDPDVRARAKALFEDWLADRSSVPPDLVDPVLHTTARLSDLADYDRILQRFRTASTPQEEVSTLVALSSVEDLDLFARTVDLYLSNEVRTQNAPSCWVLPCAASWAAVWPGRPSSGAGTRSTSATRPTASPGSWRVWAPRPTRRWPPTPAPFSASTRSPRGPSRWRRSWRRWTSTPASSPRSAPPSPTPSASDLQPRAPGRSSQRSTTLRLLV